MPEWRNGIRSGFKIRFRKVVGSNPTSGTMNYKKEIQNYISWESTLLAHKEEVAKLVELTLDHLKGLFDEDRTLFLNFLTSFFCADCGVMYIQADAYGRYTCDCSVLKDKK